MTLVDTIVSRHRRSSTGSNRRPRVGRRQGTDALSPFHQRRKVDVGRVDIGAHGGVTAPPVVIVAVGNVPGLARHGIPHVSLPGRIALLWVQSSSFSQRSMLRDSCTTLHREMRNVPSTAVAVPPCHQGVQPSGANASTRSGSQASACARTDRRRGTPGCAGAWARSLRARGTEGVGGT